MTETMTLLENRDSTPNADDALRELMPSELFSGKRTMGLEVRDSNSGLVMHELKYGVPRRSDWISAGPLAKSLLTETQRSLVSTERAWRALAGPTFGHSLEMIRVWLATGGARKNQPKYE